jgi:hypothetical protein
MKKLSIILALLFVLCQKAYALNPVAHFEKLERSYEKKLKEVCKGKKIDDMSDKEAIKCLAAYVKVLDAKIQVNYEYYVNTLDIINVHYSGDLKNLRD